MKLFRGQDENYNEKDQGFSYHKLIDNALLCDIHPFIE